MVDSCLEEYFSKKIHPESGIFRPERLHEAMTYSLFAGGKRIRPLLAIASYEACGGAADEIISQAASIELIHTYSLIHDDLPAMDNDDMRRGKLTNHKVFGDAMAILAGDALLTEAFTLFTAGGRFSPDALVKALRVLAYAAGPNGMVGGQAEDMLSEGKEPNADLVEFIHKHKTGALIAASVKVAPLLAEVSGDITDSLALYGEKVGLAFQVVDDILDLTGDDAELGKNTGSDTEQGKMTYPSVYGIKRSKEIAGELVKEALIALESIGEPAMPLRMIAEYLIKRTQ